MPVGLVVSCGMKTLHWLSNGSTTAFTVENDENSYCFSHCLELLCCTHCHCLCGPLFHQEF